MKAHSPNQFGEWHDLTEHLEAVAVSAAAFGAPFGLGDVAFWAGLWHDVGKTSCVFQQYLRDTVTHGDAKARLMHPKRGHKDLGTSMAFRNSKMFEEGGDVSVALSIEAHHGGLPDWPDFHGRKGAKLIEMSKDEALFETVKSVLSKPSPTSTVPFPKLQSRMDFEMMVRFLTSCLVDADYLDTSRHFTPHLAAMSSYKGDISQTIGRIRQFDDPTRPVDIQRALWRERAIGSARHSAKGIFRLTGPTGIGKTEGGFAAVLAHAESHKMDRVIITVPYMAITEQTADTLRSIYGDENILEHHSGVSEANDTLRRRLTSERWDAPVVVTTTVQLFESLFSCEIPKIRKLHHLANSVIVVDEPQTMPPHLLRQILDSLRWLVEHAGSTVVFQTATQPSFGLLDPAFENVPEWGTNDIPSTMRRVEWNFQDWWDDDKIVREVEKHDQVLCIVNQVVAAQRLAKSVPGAMCLTTSNHQQDRRKTIAEINRRLAAGEPCTVFSTQLVEAGVDFDFPVLFRSMAPLTSLTQAAGRCNRHGKIERGTVTVFEHIGCHGPSSLVGATELTRQMIKADKDFDPLDTKIIDLWYSRLWSYVNADEHPIDRSRKALTYRVTDDLFRMIDETVQVVIDTPESRSAMDSGDHRKVASLTVAIPPKIAAQAANLGLLIEEGDHTIWGGKYDPVIGLVRPETEDT